MAEDIKIKKKEGVVKVADFSKIRGLIKNSKVSAQEAKNMMREGWR